MVMQAVQILQVFSYFQIDSRIQAVLILVFVIRLSHAR